jgi:ABC-type phosphate transport system substrate-binding protein
MRKFAVVFSSIILILSLAVSVHAKDNYPIVDGSTSTIALDAAFRAAYLNENYNSTYYSTEHSKTFESFEKLLSGEADIILSVPITSEQEQEAKDRDFNLGRRAVAYEGFVFIVNPENPINSLSQSELRDIYSGRITNWKELGFDDANILPFQRNQNSGSQSFMNEFMKEDEIMNPPTDWIYGGMGHLVDAVSDFDNSKYSIGYSVYSFALEEMAKQKNLKILAVDGVSPSDETLSDGSYPLLSYTYAYYDADTESPLVREVLDFMISEKGQQAAADAGYTPITPLSSDSVYTALGTGEPRPKDYKPSREYSWCQFMSDDYLEGDLTDSELEENINAWISEAIKEYEFSENFYEGVLFTAVNGYLNVGVGAYPGESYVYTDDAIISVWNMKTGERLEKFSDMFYDGEDFVPAVNRALVRYSGDFSSILTGEPKNFNTASLTLKIAAADYYWISDERSGLAINALSEAWNFMPAWEYYDMTDMFTESEYVYKKTADLWIENRTNYEDMLEITIDHSRFLSEEEIAELNIDITKVYSFIKDTDLYKDFEYVNEWDEPFPTSIELSAEKTLTIKTPFGLFILNRETGVIDSPQTNPLLMAVDIDGVIDINLDGKPEYFNLDNNVITILNNDFNEIRNIDFSTYIRSVNSWQVKIENGKVSGRIIAQNFTVLDYHIEDGEIIADGLKTFGVTESGRYYEKSGGFGTIEMETGYPTMTANLKAGAESVIFTKFNLSYIEYANEIDYEYFNSVGEKISEMKKVGKPYVLVIGKEFIEITDLPDNYYYGGTVNVRHYSDGTILTETADPIGIGKSFFAFYADDNVFYPFGKGGVKATVANRKGLAFDVYTDDRYTAGRKDIGETAKEYRFGYEDGEFFEYGSIKADNKIKSKLYNGYGFYQEDFKIVLENGVITDLYYRSDGHVIINYVKLKNNTKNIKENYYTILEVDDIRGRFYSEVIRRGKGHYLPSITASIGEDISRYPEELTTEQ